MTSSTWTPEAHAEAIEMIDRCIRCPDLASIALVLTWHAWSKWPEHPIASHVWYSISQVRQGRDLPRIGATRRRDALRHCSQGAGMDDVVDPAPGPDKIVEDAELWPLFLETLSDREAEAADLFIQGYRNKDVAEELEMSQGRATQLRGQMAQKWTDLE